MEISEDLRERLLGYQKNEITEYVIYTKLSRVSKSMENRRVLERIAGEELRHYGVWKTYTGQDVKPDRWQIWKYVFISSVFGLTFGIRLMERGENDAHTRYGELGDRVAEAEQIAKDESDHEHALIELIDEDWMHYVGSIVLGLNDALVELTGALAGLSFALQNTRLIAMTGAITGFAAALSMAASEYLSIKAEGGKRSPRKAALYTGLAYVLTVIILILPFLLLQSYSISLLLTLLLGCVIIALFNFYLSVARALPFRTRFLEMAGLSLGVAAVSFVVGLLLRGWLGVDA
jgi:VIT1/CCC1 family predicted Fe2+/Mn2+ transporter